MSSYRDDREALHHRIAQLESELGDARCQGERQGRDQARAHTAELEAKLVAMRTEVERLTSEVRRFQGSPSTNGRAPVVVGVTMALLSMLILGAAVYATVRRTASTVPVPVPVVTAVPVVEPVQPDAIPLPIRTVEPPKPAPALPARGTIARWEANVKRSTGKNLPVGAPCIVEAELMTEGVSRGFVGKVSVTCGSVRLYDRSDGFSGMSQTGPVIREVFDASKDRSKFELEYLDLRTNTGQDSQIELKTKLGQVRVFRETMPAFRVELTMPARSEPKTKLQQVRVVHEIAPEFRVELTMPAWSEPTSPPHAESEEP